MGHFPFKLRDLEMDYYGVSLHKWLLAPLGTGLLYVRQRSHRVHLAAAGRARAARQRRPEVRRDRHESSRDEGRDQRGGRVPAGHRHRAQGRAPALPDAALGERVEEESADQAALQPRARSDMGPGRRVHRRHRLEQARSHTSGTSTASSLRRSDTRTSRRRA